MTSSGRYTIRVDAARAFVTVRHEGFYVVDDVRDYDRDLRLAFQQLSPGLPYRLLIDISGCVIQSQDVVKAFTDHIVDFPKADRIAIVTGSSLAKRQVTRVLQRDYLTSFQTEAEAMAWLGATGLDLRDLPARRSAA